jgi:aminopeptidase-like protein
MKPNIEHDDMYAWATDLYPICRSLTGDGVRETLRYFQALAPTLEMHSIPSGSKVFDWTVPDEWNIRGGYLEHDDGRRVVDFADHNLHVLGYSEPVDLWLDLDELQAHLHSLPEHPDWIPYVTSYYDRRWGFCLPHRLRRQLAPGRYHAVIDSTLAPGELNYGEILLPGESVDEILLSANICHPSMANNELSGPVVMIALARWLASLPSRRLSYRLLLIPETIGSIVYLSRHLKHLQQHLRAGFVIACVGDEGKFSLIQTPGIDTLADRVARHILDHCVGDYRRYSFAAGRGSDERQYCSPKVNLPVVSITRSRHSDYPEYHTSADDLSVISQQGLAGSFDLYRMILKALEQNRVYENPFFCEPQLGKRDLYPTLSTRESREQVIAMSDVLAFADGNRDLLAIAEITGRSIGDCARVAEVLMRAGVLHTTTQVR